MAGPARASRWKKTKDRPEHSKMSESCLSGFVNINGVDALTLFNSGSNTDSVSPDFARVVDLWIFELSKPITLQLGCVGSRGSINFGTHLMVRVGHMPAQMWYLDVVNLDCYDCIMGTPFMRQFNVSLDFGKGQILMGTDKIPALTALQEFTIMRGHRQFTPRKEEPGSLEVKIVEVSDLIAARHSGPAV